MTRKRSPHNRTITLSDQEKAVYQQQLLTLTGSVALPGVINQVIHQDILTAAPHLPPAFADLMIIDPPYNLTKRFNNRTFYQRDDVGYLEWVQDWLRLLIPLLKPTGTVYVCSDWRSSPMIYTALQADLIVRNRITWEREKGRGAKSNWKNTSEDIWFATAGPEYTFHAERVKLKRRVRTPYRTNSGDPKGWQQADGEKLRLTSPSNLWTDISVPFWSMSENTEHPTQKPEKLIAKLVLASSDEGDVVFAPFAGVGTTAVVAHKLRRQFVMVEHDLTYCCLAQKRLALAEENPRIQGYDEGVFWDRNTRH